jgi:hypothetical protein
MQPLYRIAGVLLLGTMALSGTHAFALPAAASSHPAGCHGHKAPAPAPAPVSYQCCVAGHHPAMPGTVFSAPRLLPDGGDAFDVRTGGSAFAAVKGRTAPIPSPPGSPPLRI